MNPNFHIYLVCAFYAATMAKNENPFLSANKSSNFPLKSFKASPQITFILQLRYASKYSCPPIYQHFSMMIKCSLEKFSYDNML